DHGRDIGADSGWQPSGHTRAGHQHPGAIDRVLRAQLQRPAGSIRAGRHNSLCPGGHGRGATRLRNVAASDTSRPTATRMLQSPVKCFLLFWRRTVHTPPTGAHMKRLLTLFARPIVRIISLSILIVSVATLVIVTNVGRMMAHSGAVPIPASQAA